MKLDNKKDYFLKMAEAVAMASKDPSSKVGAVIVDENNRVISTGYNGFVAGCDESKMTNERPMKYHLVIHAEMNAILFAKRDLSGCKVYITHSPCENCLKHMIQSGIKTIIYKDPGIMKDRGTPDQINAIRRLISSTDVVVKNGTTGKEYLEDLEVKKIKEVIIPVNGEE